MRDSLLWWKIRISLGESPDSCSLHRPLKARSLDPKPDRDLIPALALARTLTLIQVLTRSLTTWAPPLCVHLKTF